MIYSALLWMADKLTSDDGQRARQLWARKGKKAFDTECLAGSHDGIQPPQDRATKPHNAIRVLNEPTYDETVIGTVPSPLLGKFAIIEMSNNHEQKFRTSSETMSANFSGRGSSSASFL